MALTRSTPRPANVLDLLEEAESLLAQRDLIGARRAFHNAQAAGADPDRANGGLWQTHMLLGDFEFAWQQSDALRARNAPDPHRFWQGEDIRGKRVIVRCLHGFGDAVQMLRYAPRLEALASEIIFEVPPRLVPIASCFEGVHNVITWGEEAPRETPAWDVQVEIMELPYLFRTTCVQLPITTRYLTLPPEAIQQAAEKMGEATRLRVGLVCSAGTWNPSRSVQQPQLNHPHIEFWNLEGQGSASSSHRSQVEITGDGILPLAATIANLDLVITVDTLAAHLAGAQGIPAFLLLQHAADWRWLHAHTDTPWYPSLELFRQPTPGDWHNPLTAVQHRLDSLRT